MKKVLAAVLLSVFLLTGCHRSVPQQNVSSQIVREISVTVTNGHETTHHYYNTGEKMHKLLGYIRRLPPLFASEGEAEVPGCRIYAIEMTCADGSLRRYDQMGDRFFRSGDGPWQRIGGQKGMQLWQILMTTPDDPAPDK